MSNWFNRRLTYSTVLADPNVASSPLPDIAARFHAYKFVWTKSDIKFYVDNNVLKTHTANVPTASAYVIVNHWGTNNPNGFGGWADTNQPDRYFYVDWVRYTPPGGSVASATTTCPSS